MLLNRMPKEENFVNVIDKSTLSNRSNKIKKKCMYTYGTKILREKIKETNVSSSNKFQVSNTMPLCQILSLRYCATFCKMALKKVNTLSKKSPNSL